MASIVISGDTSGSITVSAPAVAGSNTISLPASTGTLVTTGAPASGNVIQVVNAVITTQTSTASSSLVSTAMTASITPKFATSKILFVGSFYTRIGTAGASLTGALYRNSTNITTGNIGCIYIYGNATTLEITSPAIILDSPATTSATTYTIYIKNIDAAGTVYIGNGNFSSTITLLEIAA